MRLSEQGQLILNGGVLALIAALLWAGYTDPGVPRTPLVTYIPIWAVIAATLIGGYFWERRKRRNGRATWRSGRQRLEFLGYFLLSTGAAAAAKLLFSPTAIEIYFSAYWTLVALAALAMLYCFTAQHYFHQPLKRTESALLALVVLAGIASAPISALYQAGGTPLPVAVVMVIFIAPLLLREAGFPRSSVPQRSSVT